MSYQVRFSDYSKSITVQDLKINNDLSVSFVGRDYKDYAPAIAENFLHLLENFANTTSPRNPIQGQLWFDNSSGVNYLKIYNGASWGAVGFVQKSIQEPENPSVGDLWVNPAAPIKQLRIFTGSSDPTLRWQLVGPSNTTDTTKINIEILYDNKATPTAHEVISFFIKNNRIGIISRDSFTLKTPLVGFIEIKPGFNLSTQLDIKFQGIATSAETLVINNVRIDPARFLRTDIENVVSEKVTIKTNDGITIGNSPSLTISVAEPAVNLQSTASMLFRAGENSLLCLTDTGRVGIGTTSPVHALDITGTTSIQGELTVTNGIDSVLTVDVDNNTVHVHNRLEVPLLVADHLTVEPQLPQVQDLYEYNSNVDYIGRIEVESALTGVWVGTAISVPITPSAAAMSEYLIMTVDATGNTSITGWESFVQSGTPNIYRMRAVDSIPPGKLLRISESLPCLYFYEINSNNLLTAGCALYSVLVNRIADTATFTLVSNGNCASPTVYWKNINFVKVSDIVGDADTIRSAAEDVVQGWY